MASPPSSLRSEPFLILNWDHGTRRTKAPKRHGELDFIDWQRIVHHLAGMMQNIIHNPYLNEPVENSSSPPILKLAVKERRGGPITKNATSLQIANGNSPRSPPPSRPSNPFLLILVHFANPNYRARLKGGG